MGGALVVFFAGIFVWATCSNATVGRGQIFRSVASGAAADWLGIDGLLAASIVLLVIALLPLRWLRGSEHLVGAPALPAPG